MGTQLAVLYRKVSLIQTKICTQLYVPGTADTVLIREVSLIRSVLYREVPLCRMSEIRALHYTKLKCPRKYAYLCE